MREPKENLHYQMPKHPFHCNVQIEYFQHLLHGTKLFCHNGRGSTATQNLALIFERKEWGDSKMK